MTNPEALDIAFMIDFYNHLKRLPEMRKSWATTLKADGTLVVVKAET